MTESHYHRIFNLLDDAIFMADMETGRVVDANQQAGVLLGCSRDEIIGIHMESLHPPEFIAEHRPQFDGYVASDKFDSDLDSEILRKDGRIIPVSCSATLLESDGRRLIVGVFRDRSRRRLAEREQEATVRLLRLINAAQNMEDLVGKAVAFLQEWLGCDAVEIRLREGEELPYLRADRSGSTDAPTTVVPLRLGEEILGLLQVNEGRTGHLDEKTVALLERLADHLAIAISHRRTEQALRETEARYRSLFEQSPIPLLLGDYSAIKYRTDMLRAEGIADFRDYFLAHPEEVRRWRQLIRYIDINASMVRLYGAPDKRQVLEALKQPPEDDRVYDLHREAFIAIGEGKTFLQMPEIAVRIADKPVHLSVRCSVPPGYEQTYSQVLVTFIDITERKRSEDALRESQRMLTTLMSNLPGMAYRCRNDEKWTVEFASDGCLALTGYAVEDLLHNRVTPYGQIIHEDDRRMVWDRIQSAVRERRPYQIVYRIRTAQGVLKQVWEQGCGVYGPDGEVHAVEGFIADISERVQAEEALRASEERHRLLVELSPDAIYIHKRGHLVFINAAGLRLFGADRPEQILGRSMLELIHPDFRSVVAQRIHVIEEQGRAVPLLAEKILRLDGGITDIEAAATSFEHNGEPAVLVIARDITERRQAEEALRASEDKYRTLFETMAQGVIYLDAAGRITSANAASGRIMGFAVEDMIGRDLYDPCWDVIQEDGTAFPADRFPAVLALRNGARNKAVLGVMNPQTGKRSWISVSAVPLFRDGVDRPDEVYITFEDLTDRKQATEALQESEERFRRLAHNAQDVIYRCRVHPAVSFEYVSQAVATTLGYTPEECYSDHEVLMRSIHPDDKAQSQAYLAGKLPFDKPALFRAQHRDKHWVVLEIRSTPIYDSDGCLIFLEGIGRDITDRQRAEEAQRERTSLRELSHRIIQSQEEERRRLSRELHDEAGQALTAIKLNTELLAKRMPDNMPDLKRRAQDTAEVTASLISEMRRIAAALRPAVLEDLGLLPTLRWYAKGLEMRYGLRVKLISRGLGSRLNKPFETTIYRIVQEALTNVVRHAQAKQAVVKVTCGKGGLDLLVQDNGKGMDLSRVRQSTGLTGIRERANLFGGTVTLKSEVGEGTTLRIRFKDIPEANT